MIVRRLNFFLTKDSHKCVVNGKSKIMFFFLVFMPLYWQVILQVWQHPSISVNCHNFQFAVRSSSPRFSSSVALILISFSSRLLVSCQNTVRYKLLMYSSHDVSKQWKLPIFQCSKQLSDNSNSTCKYSLISIAFQWAMQAFLPFCTRSLFNHNIIYNPIVAYKAAGGGCSHYVAPSGNYFIRIRSHYRHFRAIGITSEKLPFVAFMQYWGNFF